MTVTSEGKNALVAGAGGVTVEPAMTTLPENRKTGGFTLIELLAVIAVIAVLATILLPSVNHKVRPTLTRCLSNQRQICLGLLLWQSDNDNQFPWQRSTATNGTRELIPDGQAASQMRSLSAYIKWFSIYNCPTDKDKVSATDYDHFTDTNISYFINVDVTTNTSNLILTGDRNLRANSRPIKPGLFELRSNLEMSWTHDMHLKGGVLAFADGHSEYILINRLNPIIQQQPGAAYRLCIP